MLLQFTDNNSITSAGIFNSTLYHYCFIMIVSIRSAKNKKFLNIVTGIIICLIMKIIFADNKIIDNLVLLEERNPEYFEYLSNQNVQVLYLPGNISRNYNDNINSKENLLLDYGITQGNINGVDFKYNNSQLTLNGTAKETSWPGITYENIKLVYNGLIN